MSSVNNLVIHNQSVVNKVQQVKHQQHAHRLHLRQVLLLLRKVTIERQLLLLLRPQYQWQVDLDHSIVVYLVITPWDKLLRYQDNIVSGQIFRSFTIFLSLCFSVLSLKAVNRENKNYKIWLLLLQYAWSIME